MSIKLNAQSGGSVALDAPTQTTSSADNVYKLPVADGSAGQVLKTDGSGNLSWVDQPTVPPATDPGLPMADQWKLNATQNIGFNSYYTVGDGDWERCDHNGFGQLGTGMTESSNVFSFPSTGIYLVQFTPDFDAQSDSPSKTTSAIMTDTGSGFGSVSESNFDSWMRGGLTNSMIFDVTDTSTHKVKFIFYSAINATRSLFGHSSITKTNAVFLKLGPT